MRAAARLTTISVAIFAVGAAAFLYWRVAPYRAPDSQEQDPAEAIIPVGPHSLPTDPWTAAPVPIQGTLLVLPFTNEETGLMDDNGERLLVRCVDYLTLVAPRSLGMVSPLAIKDVVRGMQDYRGDGLLEMSAEAEGALLRYYGATHIVRASYGVKGEELIISASFQGEGAPVVQTFRVPAEHDSEAARQLMLWALKAGNFRDMPENYEADLAQVLGGPGSESIVRDLTIKPPSPEFDAISSDIGGRRMRGIIAIENGDGSAELLHGVLPPILPVDARFSDRQMRFLVLHTLQNASSQSLHEARLLIALYPGATQSFRAYYDNRFGSLVNDRLRLVDLDQWFARTAQVPAQKIMLAKFYGHLASESRGSGWARNVTKEGWDGWNKYNELTVKLAAEAMKETGPIPATASLLCTTYFRLGDDKKALEVHDDLLARFPDAMGTWWAVSNFLLPRWGGSHEEFNRRVRTNWKLRPNNAALSIQVLRYYLYEAFIEKNTDQLEWLDQLAQRNPAIREILLEAIDAAALPHASDRDWAVAFTIAAMLEKNDVAMELVRQRPDLYQHLLGILDDVPSSYNEGRAVESLVRLGDFKHARTVYQNIFETDKIREARTEDNYNNWTATSFPENVNFYDALLQAAEGTATATHFEGLYEYAAKYPGIYTMVGLAHVLAQLPASLDLVAKIETALLKEGSSERDLRFEELLAILYRDAGDPARAAEWEAKAAAATEKPRYGFLVKREGVAPADAEVN
jgi:hypothetical protein